MLGGVPLAPPPRGRGGEQVEEENPSTGLRGKSQLMIVQIIFSISGKLRVRTKVLEKRIKKLLKVLTLVTSSMKKKTLVVLVRVQRVQLVL